MKCGAGMTGPVAARVTVTLGVLRPPKTQVPGCFHFPQAVRPTNLSYEVELEIRVKVETKTARIHHVNGSRYAIREVQLHALRWVTGGWRCVSFDSFIHPS
jgi:hypothetical protein